MDNKQEILNSFSKQVNIINTQIVNGDYKSAIDNAKLLATYLSVKLNDKEEKEEVNERI